MKVNKIVFASLTLFLSLGLAACSSSSQQSKQDQTKQAETTQQHEHESTNTTGPSNSQVGKSIQDEINGLAAIESSVNKDDFKSAAATFEQIHEEYHAAVLPAVEDKDAKLGEDMHNKFDALEEAINSKDKNLTLNMIKVNRNNLNQAAKELNINLK